MTASLKSAHGFLYRHLPWVIALAGLALLKLR